MINETEKFKLTEVGRVLNLSHQDSSDFGIKIEAIANIPHAPPRLRPPKATS